MGIIEASPDPVLLGQRVVGEINAYCGECPTCLAGRPTQCPPTLDSPQMPVSGERQHHLVRQPVGAKLPVNRPLKTYSVLLCRSYQSGANGATKSGVPCM